MFRLITLLTLSILLVSCGDQEEVNSSMEAAIEASSNDFEVIDVLKTKEFDDFGMMFYTRPFQGINDAMLATAYFEEDDGQWRYLTGIGGGEYYEADQLSVYKEKVLPATVRGMDEEWLVYGEVWDSKVDTIKVDGEVAEVVDGNDRSIFYILRDEHRTPEVKGYSIEGELIFSNE
ncbi:hypothetical protein J2R98_001148 [Alkalibacillus filiformis]|uniref:Lipoprotein n=1 Tax=Alkalibacillus filiformis TaxID=200990 RepID=A0ABU0DSA6_9BACI|nr:hypothetical protein [Alkalibacillus filiformis]MDQ0351334.1 hypothetical protein [Alkalibacillus filiformis]